MKDLFYNTKFIKFELLETILNSTNLLNKLLYNIDDPVFCGYTLDDYISNIDSYLFGLVLMPSNDSKELIKWIKNYMFYLFIPVIEVNSIYIVKSKLISEIFKINSSSSRIVNDMKSLILEEVFLSLKDKVFSKEEDIQNIILKQDDFFLDYLIRYYDIYENKNFIKNIYINYNDIRDDLISLFPFLN